MKRASRKASIATPRLARLPNLLARKIYKTGQTRGADDDVIYQNRVARTSTVLIPYARWGMCGVQPKSTRAYENGFIVLLSPVEYFGKPDITKELAAKGLAIGKNALVFYETREQWNANRPDAMGWKAAIRRTKPLGGQYVARVPANTAAKNGGKIIRGFNATAMKGAGIRVYEYASSATNEQCRLQLEALFWLCRDSDDVAAANGMTAKDAATRKAATLARCREDGMLDLERLTEARIVNAGGGTVCPLCLEELSGQGFFDRMEQAEGRLVHDLTVTQVNLFHIAELRFGTLNHRPYNVGWGHHHCNVVVKDSGIKETLNWMHVVLNRNIAQGYLRAENKTN